MLIPWNAPPPYQALLLLAEGDPGAALPQARQLFQEQQAGPATARAWASYTLGWALLRRDQLDEARQRLTVAQAAFADLGDYTLLLHCQRALLLALLCSGDTSDLPAQTNALTAAYQAAGLPLDAARTQLCYLAYLNIIGMPQPALELAQQLTPLLHTHGTRDDQGRLLRLMGLATRQTGQLEQAAALQAQARNHFAALGYHTEEAKCLLELAHISELRGLFDQALDQLGQARAIFRRLSMPRYAAACEKTLGLIASRLGRLDLALEMTLRARTSLLELGQHEQAAGCDLNLGNIAYYSGLFELALLAYRRAEGRYSELHMQHERLIALRNQALVLDSQGQPDAAYALLSELEAAVTDLGDALELAAVYQYQGRILQRLERSDEALERIMHAERQLRALGSLSGVGQCLLERGWLALARGDLDEAERCLHESQAIQADPAIYSWRIRHGLGRCAEARGQAARALDLYQQASALVARLRHTLVNEHASSALFDQARLLYEDAIRLAVVSDMPASLLALAEEQRALALQQRKSTGRLHIPRDLLARYERQRQGLSRLIYDPPPEAQLDTALTEYIDLLLHIGHSAPLAARAPAEVPDLRQLRPMLDRHFPAGWQVLSYIEQRDELLIVQLDRHSMRLTRRAWDLELRRLIEEACLPQRRLQLYHDWPRLFDPTRRPWDTLARLADALLPPAVQLRLHPDCRLLIVPSGQLHHLPWATLRLADSWLCERAVVQIVPSLTLWEPCPAQPTDDGAALLVGCQQFAARAEPLPQVAAELDQVAAVCGGRVTRLLDAAATRRALLDTLHQPAGGPWALLHIASHAQLVAAHGLLAHIKLWDDDLLFDELARLELAGVLVVLSTCDGAASEVLPGEEVLNLSRAFLSAGAGDVIANLWPSQDALAPWLMRRLYGYLATGADPASAVAQTQRALLALPEGSGAADPLDARSPLAWGGFQAIGSGTTRLQLAGQAGGVPPA